MYKYEFGQMKTEGCCIFQVQEILFCSLIFSR